MKYSINPARYFALWGPVRVACALLSVAAIALVAILLFADNPWDARSSGRFKVADYVAVWFWIGAAANLVLMAVLFATAPIWAVRLRSRPEPPSAVARPVWFLPLVLLAAAVLIGTALPRMSGSLWHDEASRTKSTMVGYHQARDDGSVKFKRVKWQDAMFESRLPNHVFQSIVSKLSHDLAKSLSLTGPNGLSEAALRLPSLVGGVSAVLLLGILLGEIGEPLGGVVAAWLLALHPWFLRYASEARGYAIVMALLPLLIIAFLRAVQTGKVRWWVVMGLTQTAMVYTYALSVYIPLVLALLAPVYIFAGRRQGIDAPRVLRHWLVTCLLSAALFAQLFLPCVPPLLRYLNSSKGFGLGNTMGSAWISNVLSQAWIGIPWTNSFLIKTDYAELLPWAALNHPAFLALVVFTVAVGLAGIFRAFQLGRSAVLAVAVLLLPAPLCFVETKLRGGYLYEWYLVYIIVGLCAVAGLGLSAPAAWLRGRITRWLAMGLCVVVVGAYGYATQPQRAELMARSLQPYREAVLVARPSLDPKDPAHKQVITAFFHAGTLVYDPFLTRISTVRELSDLMQKADTENKELFLTLGYLSTTAAEHPSKWRLVAQSGLFDDPTFLRGFHPELSLEVFHYRRGAAEGFDFSAYPEDIPSGRKFYHE